MMIQSIRNIPQKNGTRIYECMSRYQAQDFIDLFFKNSSVSLTLDYSTYWYILKVY